MARGIPALTLSGGKLSDFGGLKAAKEFRIWVHPVGGGDDFYYSFATLEAARTAYRTAYRKGRRADSGKQKMRVDAPIAVVWDAKYKKYREVVIGSAGGRKIKKKIDIMSIGL